MNEPIRITAPAHLAAVLDLLRCERRLTYRALAEAAGLPMNTIYDGLTAAHAMTVDTMLAVARPLGAHLTLTPGATP